MSPKPQILPATAFAVALLSGCGGEGEGDVTVTVYGEEFIEVGIPADEMADGWAVDFERFVVGIEKIAVGGVEMTAPDPIDISVATGGAGHPIATAAVPVGAHSGSRYRITEVSLAGSATKDGVTKTFDWSFDEPTDYSACETTTLVEEGETATFEITVHADHFFYDSLVAEEPQVVFQALADADADADGIIARTELEASDLGAYDAGSGGDVQNLWAFLVAQSRSLGHVDGEGHCDARAVPQ